MLHTGDITHLSKPEEFDAAEQILKAAKTGEIFYVPGEHDVLGDNGKSYLDRYGQEHERRRMVQLRSEGRSLHRPGERDGPEGRRPGLARATNNWSGSRRT